MYSHLTENIEIDRRQHKVRKDGQEVHLTHLEYGLLDYLAAHANRVCPRQAVLDHVWGTVGQYDSGKLDVHLNALRRKLAWNSKHPIETIRSVGFILRIEQRPTRYTLDLESLMTQWLASRQMDIRSAGLVAQLQLTPFVNGITIDPEALRRMLDSALTALLSNARAGILRLSTRLTADHFILSLDVGGTVCELRTPLYKET